MDKKGAYCPIAIDEDEEIFNRSWDIVDKILKEMDAEKSKKRNEGEQTIVNYKLSIAN
ncbi:MAG: hypothetical protein FWH05_01860 [Oscillospiraceae bacterium]|nr:hypothetical protein [Oscillospiraceae bacterium]